MPQDVNASFICNICISYKPLDEMRSENVEHFSCVFGTAQAQTHNIEQGGVNMLTSVLG